MDFCFLVVPNPNLVHGPAEVHFCDPTVTHVGVEALGLVFEVFHHLGTIDAGRIAREIVDLGRLSQLTSRLLALVKDGFHVRTSGVDGSGVSGRTRSDDQATVVFSSAHGIVSMWTQK